MLRIRLRCMICALALGASACSSGTSTGGSESNQDRTGDRNAAEAASHGEPQAGEALNLLSNADLETMAEESDLVVSGTVVAAEHRVPIGAVEDRLAEHQRGQPGDQGVNLHSVLTIDVDDVIRGSTEDTIDVIYLTHIDGDHIAPEGRTIGEPEEYGVWFLLEIDPMFDRTGYVVTTHFSSLIADRHGTLPESDSEAPFMEDLQVFTTIDELIESLQT